MHESEKLFISSAQRVKSQLQALDSQSHFVFRFEASGRVHDGELKIEISLGSYGSEVTGRDVESVVKEFMRRKGWNDRNTPLELPNVAPPTIEEQATRAVIEGENDVEI